MIHMFKKNTIKLFQDNYINIKLYIKCHRIADINIKIDVDFSYIAQSCSEHIGFLGSQPVNQSIWPFKRDVDDNWIRSPGSPLPPYSKYGLSCLACAVQINLYVFPGAYM